VTADKNRFNPSNQVIGGLAALIATPQPSPHTIPEQSGLVRILRAITAVMQICALHDSIIMRLGHTPFGMSGHIGSVTDEHYSDAADWPRPRHASEPGAGGR
jgi:hypothetical protein